MWNTFEIIGEVSDIETIASGPGVRVLPHLRKTYGCGRWRKLKGTALIRVAGGGVRTVEVHWYEAHGIGRKEIKIKRYLDRP